MVAITRPSRQVFVAVAVCSASNSSTVAFSSTFFTSSLSSSSPAAALASNLSPLTRKPPSRRKAKARRYYDNRSIVTLCRASKNINDDDLKTSSKQRASSSSSARERGIYARPSGAIERGSGFFIPGLEGYKIRLLFGLVVLIVDALTAFTTTGGSGPPTITTAATTFKVEDVGMIVSEALAAIYGLLLLLQGSIELAIETRGINISDGGIIEESNDNDDNYSTIDRDSLFGTEQNNDSTNHYVDESSSGISSFDVAIRKLARAIIAFTPATNVQLVSEDLKLYYSFGSSSSSVDD